MTERDLEAMIDEISAIYRRHLRGAGAPNATIVLLLEELSSHIIESINCELGLKEVTLSWPERGEG